MTLPVPEKTNFLTLAQEASRSLSRGDLCAVATLLLRVHRTESVSSFFATCRTSLMELIPSEGMEIAVHRFRTGMRAVRVTGFGQPSFRKEHYDYYSRNALEHPVTRHFVTTGEYRAIRVSDLLSTEEWIQTDFWKVCLSWLNYRYTMIAIWPLSRNSILIFVFNRRNTDFTPREKHLLDATFPLLGQHYQTLLRLARLRDALRSKKPKQERYKEPLDIGNLTRREAEVLAWLGEGKNNHEIALILEISPRTVQKHVENILRKLHLENRYAAAAHATLLS